jgi:hypothetical protein
VSAEPRHLVLSPQPTFTGGEERPAGQTPRAPRLGSLDGKTIYLVDTGFGGSYKFMEQLQRWFKANLPGVATVRRRKPGNVFADDGDQLWEEIRAKGDAAVLGVGG